MGDKEHGFPICKNGGVTKGRTVTGDEHAVIVPLVCPRGSKVIGVHHSHPGGSLQLSQLDIRTAHEKRLKYVCVKAQGKTKCYRFKKT